MYAATKYNLRVMIMTMTDNMTESDIKIPIPSTGTGPIKAKICKLKIAHYIYN
jgi:hypothetical protein